MDVHDTNRERHAFIAYNATLHDTTLHFPLSTLNFTISRERRPPFVPQGNAHAPKSTMCIPTKFQSIAITSDP